ncbi:DUF5719 family protein [Microbacterium sp. BR1]|uniref:DUF5719 family protein n=1 Tax=Microbacterium sp. BR1 TaxID=1070896 RepID=UPI000C2B7010|nr:DUF5719 family protein [Microbacterium sp. BR1]
MRATGWLRALTTSTRVLIGAFLAVVIVVVVIAAVGFPVPGLTREALRIVDTPTPSESVAVCPGPLLATGRTFGAAGDVSVAGEASVVSGAPEGSPREDSLSARIGEGPRVLRLEPTGDVPAALAAAQSSTVADDDLSGFAATACTSPQFESWLVGGATTTGSSDLVVLSNPGDVAATVQLTVYASTGALAPPGGRDVVVAAGSQVVLPLAGLVLGELAPVIRVQAEGAAVVAHLQTSRTQTLQPVGLDVTGPTSAPTEHQRIVGLVTPNPGEGAASNVATASVRLLAPSQAVSAKISVFAMGATQPVGQPVDVPLSAGVPLEIDLPGLSAGTYTIEVTASSPIVAAGWSSTAADGVRDNAWIAASPALDEPSFVAVAPAPAGASPTFRVAADDEPARVTLTPLDGGAPIEVSLEAGVSQSFTVASGVWRVEASDTVFASIGYAGPAALAGYPVSASAQASAAVVVVP